MVEVEAEASSTAERQAIEVVSDPGPKRSQETARAAEAAGHGAAARGPGMAGSTGHEAAVAGWGRPTTPLDSRSPEQWRRHERSDEVAHTARPLS